MCEEEHHTHHHHHHRRHRFGRRGPGFPSREQLVERLTSYRAHLERELENVQDLLERLGDAPEQAPPAPETI
jgi:hypothetical protein